MDFYTALKPLLYLLAPELAHKMALAVIGAGLAPAERTPDPPSLAVELWGRRFANPIGSAAGFDKDAEAIAGTLGLGFGFVEVGSITPRPQVGNPKPRLFRLTADRAVINRMAFNSQGQAQAAARLVRWRASGRPGLVGVNLGKNFDAPSAEADYETGARTLGALADYLVINVSSPNTPGLRRLQGRAELAGLIAAVRRALAELEAGRRPPLLVKISPDLAEADLAELADVALEAAVDGLIATNTTLSRPAGLRTPQRDEAGGLSGEPLFELSTQVLARLYELTEGRIPLIGVGGVASGAQAYRKIRAGASLVQLYSGLVYGGPGLVARIKRELAELLARDGFAQVGQAVGADHRKETD